MCEFFRCSKRKAGIATLLIACLLTTGWLRSYSVEDQISYRSPGSKDSQCLYSFRGGITWARRTTEADFPAGANWHSNVIDPIDRFFIYIPGIIVEWNWSYGGFDAGEFHDLEAPAWRMAWWTVPYMSVVVPLTLSSAWLLLGKPRAKQARSSQVCATHPQPS